MKRKYKQLINKYYEEENKKSKERIKEKLYKRYGTNKYCYSCHQEVLISDLKQYKYLCLNCDENLFSFEVVNKEKI